MRLRGTLSRTAAELGDKGFVKTSASHIVNMAQVVHIRQGAVVMADGSEIFFSRSQRKPALERLAGFVDRTI